MTDILERLRQPASMLTIEEGTKLLHEAADEIERLRERLRMCNCGGGECRDEGLWRAEIDRLRKGE